MVHRDEPDLGTEKEIGPGKKYNSQFLKDVTKSVTNSVICPNGIYLPSIVFAGKFEVDVIDKKKKKFDKVSRLEATFDEYDIGLVLDYNSELLSLEAGDQFILGLCGTLSTTEPLSTDPKAYLQPAGWNQSHSLEDTSKLRYVMYGKIYRYEKASDNKMVAYISFGGLLMSLTGLHSYLELVQVNNYVYLVLG